MVGSRTKLSTYSSRIDIITDNVDDEAKGKRACHGNKPFIYNFVSN